MFKRSLFASGMSRDGIGDFNIVLTSLMRGLRSRKLCSNDGGCFPPAVPNNNNNVRSVISTATNIRNVILKKKVAYMLWRNMQLPSSGSKHRYLPTKLYGVIT